MRYIRLLILSFIVLFVVVTIMSLFIPSRVRISKAINIQTTTAGTDSLIGDMGQWKKWNPFFSELGENTINHSTPGQEGTEMMEVNGTMVKWLQRSETEYVAEMSRGKREPVHNGWSIITYNSPDSLTVQWYMDFHLNWYPWEKFGSLLFEKSYSGKMEQGLTTLKQLLEAEKSSRR